MSIFKDPDHVSYVSYDWMKGGDAIEDMQDLSTLQLYFKADTSKKVLELFREVTGLTGERLHESTMTTRQTNDIKKWNEFLKTLETDSANGIVNLSQITGNSNLKFIMKTDIGKFSAKTLNNPSFLRFSGFVSN